jgi:hypothetical protein
VIPFYSPSARWSWPDISFTWPILVRNWTASVWLSSFATTLMLAWATDDQPSSRWPRNRLRWIEGLALGAALALMRVTAGPYAVAAGLVGFLTEFLIPTWYRELPRKGQPIAKRDPSDLDAYFTELWQEAEGRAWKDYEYIELGENMETLWDRTRELVTAKAAQQGLLPELERWLEARAPARADRQP